MGPRQGRCTPLGRAAIANGFFTFSGTGGARPMGEAPAAWRLGQGPQS